jgi:quercetin 2,3-dioxygenase
MRLPRRTFLAGGASGVLLGAAGLAACSTRSPRKGATAREAATVVDALPTREGAGVRLRRSVGSRALPLVDPFLLLDEIRSAREDDWIRGFPDHPHRGFETVSILIAGAFEHRDSVGNHGRIADGGAQWMTAGHGIVHAEMPAQAPGLELWGLQLWVNLPAARKMMRPRYQDLGASDVPGVELGGARARVIAGLAGGATGPVDGIVTRPTLLDLAWPATARVRLPLPPQQTVLIYGLDGALRVGERGAGVGSGQAAVLGAGDEVLLAADAGARCLLFAGTPLGEPVARRGPFVMNTEAELDQAVADYRSGRLTSG